MVYTKYGPFTDLVGSPGVSAEFLNPLETELAATRYANVRAYGAKGDGTTDDTTAFTNAIASGLPVYAPAGSYLIGALTMTGGALFGDGWQTKLIAKTGTATMLTAHQSSGFRIENIWLHGNGIAATCIDTAWTIPTGQAAPSLNNQYSFVRVSGYTTTGWVATSNNDSSFDSCLIEAVTGATGVDLRAYGGAVVMKDCRVLSLLIIGCQQANILGCVLKGVQVTGSDYNSINGVGGYWYANPSTGVNISITSGTTISSPITLTGVHMENGTSSGVFLGGSGAVQGTMRWTGCHIFTTGGATGVNLVAPSVGVQNGIPALVLLVACFVETVTVDPTYNANIGISLEGTSVFGYQRGPGRRSVTVAQGATVTVPQIPRAGLATFRVSSGAGPWLHVSYGRSGSSAGSVTTLGSSGAGITFAIPSGAANDVTTTDAQVSHNIAASVVIEMVFVGF